MSEQSNNSPFNTIPPVVAALSLFILGIELVFYLGAAGILGGPQAVGWRLAAFQQYAFSSEIFLWMLETGRFLPEHMVRLISYLFLHGSFTGALFAAAMVLALGKMVGEVFSGLATLLVFVLSGLVGAIAFALILQSPIPLIGAFPGVYGLIGAYSFLMWVQLRLLGEDQKRAFYLIGGLMGIQLVFGLLFGGTGDWVADLAGFGTGFALSFVFVPGGWARIREMLQRR